jgi:hypothetical protein
MLETASLILRVAFMPKKIMYLTDSKKWKNMSMYIHAYIGMESYWRRYGYAQM